MLRVRQFQPTDIEYEAYIKVLCQCWPEEPPPTVVELKYGDSQWGKGKLFQRFILECKGKIVGAGSYFEPYWLDVQGKYQFNFDVLPEYEGIQPQGVHPFSFVERYVRKSLAGCNLKALKTSAREDKERRQNWLKQQGFVCLMRYPISKLEVLDCDLRAHEYRLENAVKAGYGIFGLDFLQEHDKDWHRKLYDAWLEIELDVPSPEPPKPISLEEFDKMFQHPAFTAKSWAVAVVVDERAPGKLGEYAGLSANNAAISQPEIWSIWLTGVRRAHRRRGLAIALKLECIKWAKALGIKEFQTGNEENNPMFHINMQLGFKPQPAWQDWEKALAND